MTYKWSSVFVAFGALMLVGPLSACLANALSDSESEIRHDLFDCELSEPGGEICSVESETFVAGELYARFAYMCLSMPIFDEINLPPVFGDYIGPMFGDLVIGSTDLNVNLRDPVNTISLWFDGAETEAFELKVNFTPPGTWIARATRSEQQVFEDIVRNIWVARDVTVHVPGSEPRTYSLNGFSESQSEFESLCEELGVNVVWVRQE